MRPCVWITGHNIADTVGSQIRYGLNACPIYYTKDLKPEIIEAHDVHIAYGILRGCTEVFIECDRKNKPWLEVDKGYWKPGHYDGYYRISLRGTQQTTGLDRLEPDYERWDKLGIEILPHQSREFRKELLCPATDYVTDFFSVKTQRNPTLDQILLREKGCSRSLQADLDGCSFVRTFNSSVGWEALRQGIPVISDSTHSIVGAYGKLLDTPLHADYEARRRLFGIMAGLQLTLEEIREGLLWPLMKRLMSSSDMMIESQ